MRLDAVVQELLFFTKVRYGSDSDLPTSCLNFRCWGESRPPARPAELRFLAIFGHRDERAGQENQSRSGFLVRGLAFIH